MNVIVSNKHKEMLQTLNIDVIKSIDGEFDVDEIIATFKNFFFQRMILDITAIKDGKNINTLQKLSIALDMDKVILLLDSEEDASNQAFLSQLISIGIYNFTRNAEGIMYLYNNPNSYKDVAQYHEINSISNISNMIKAAPKKEVIPNNQQSVIVNNLESANNALTSAPNVNDTIVSSAYLNPNTQLTKTVIGVKNVTKTSGATTLVYLMKKELERYFNVLALEIGKRDFMFFPDKNLVSVSKEESSAYIDNNRDKDVILVDLNDDAYAEQKCDIVLYLIEPSVIKLNRLMITNGSILKTLTNKKVVLNQSLLSSKDVLDFEYEAKLKVFYNLPPLNDREDANASLTAFLSKLGFGAVEGGKVAERKKILGIF